MPKGIPNIPLPPFEDRFWSRVNKQFLGCWEWVGAMHRTGYGVNGLPYGGSRMAHRVAYCLMKGGIPKGLDLDHLCRNRRCVNPDHLEPVSRRENLLRGETLPAANAKKTHCAKGHQLSGENLVLAQLRVGKRACRICFNESMRHYGSIARQRRKAIKTGES